MKKAIEIIEQSKKNSAEIARIDEILKNTPFNVKKIDSKFIELSEKQNNLQIENMILHDNARRVLYAEVMPIAIEIINKYAGKQYGEKTKQKIKEEFKEKVNCTLYIYASRYSQQITITPLNEKGFNDWFFEYSDFDIYIKHTVNGEKQNILINNKIQKITLDMFYLSNCAAYVDNVTERIEEIKNNFAAAQEAQKALEKACKDFNTLLPRGIEHLNYSYLRSYLL